MHSHLVTIKVGVKSGTSQRVQLNSFTLNHTRLERQDTMTVQGRSTVQQYRMTFHYMFQNLKDNRFLAVNNFLSRFHSLHQSALNEFTDNKRFVQFRRHIFRQTAFVHFQFRTDNNNRTSRIVHTFTEQVLTETTLFTFQ